MLSAYQRAKAVAKWLIEANDDKLGSRKFDDQFENGDGDQVVRELIQILADRGINSFEQLPLSSQRYACREWWTDEYKVDPETVFGIPLF